MVVGWGVLSARAALLLYVLALALLLSGGALGGGGLLGIAAAEWLFIAAPAVVAARARGRVAAVLHLHWPRPRALAGALLIGASAWLVLAALVLPLQERIAPMPPELVRALEALVGTEAPLVLALLALAVTPAVCEELLCRGALLFSLRGSLGRAGAIAASAALFAALHLSPHRFLPTFLLGLAFGAMALASRSIVPAMVAHAVNNAAVVVVGHPAGAPLAAALEAHAATATMLAVIALTIGGWLAMGRTSEK
jgi:sodium transport system permease protein